MADADNSAEGWRRREGVEGGVRTVTEQELPADHGNVKDAGTNKARRRPALGRLVAFGILPAVLLALAIVAGYLKYIDDSARAIAGCRHLGSTGGDRRDHRVAVLHS
jgi:hypothetical protein